MRLGCRSNRQELVESRAVSRERAIRVECGSTIASVDSGHPSSTSARQGAMPTGGYGSGGSRGLGSCDGSL